MRYRPFSGTRVVIALMLREMATTYGRSPGGYVWTIVEPVAGIGLMTVVFSFIVHAPVLGSSFSLFYATGFLPFVAYLTITNRVGGAIRYWPVQVSGHPVLLLGPVAVHPTAQGEGLAASMIRDSLAEAAEHWDRVMLVGDYPYYKRFGFEVLDGVEMPPPTNPDRTLGLALHPGAWDGVKGEVGKA